VIEYANEISYRTVNVERHARRCGMRELDAIFRGPAWPGLLSHSRAKSVELLDAMIVDAGEAGWRAKPLIAPAAALAASSSVASALRARAPSGQVDGPCAVKKISRMSFPIIRRGGRGRPPIKGERQKKLSAVLLDRKVSWQRHRVSLWYGRTNRIVEIATGTALWYRGGVPPVPIRWLLVRDPTGELDPQAFLATLATDLDAHPRDILAWFVSRWQVEVTFEEVRAHLGVKTQRQSSDNAIRRTTPVLLGLFAIVTLWAHDLAKSRKLKPRAAAWYPKTTLTFSDAIATVRREIWHHQISFMSRPRRDSIEIPRHIWHGMENALAHAA
jgi:hypothetical protein